MTNALCTIYICIEYQIGLTALMTASWHGHVDIAKYLVDKNAGLDIQNKVSICRVHVHTYACMCLCVYTNNLPPGLLLLCVDRNTHMIVLMIYTYAAL